jgi:diguanylate cyclase (GGDEF)-like protein/PAS domain S-box-containing protein
LFDNDLFDLVPLARDAIVEKMSDAVIVLDENNRIADLNQSAQTMLGYHRDQVVGMTIERIWSAWPIGIELPADVQELKHEVSLQAGDVQKFMEIRSSALLDQQQNLTGRLVIIRDITRQKRVEETVKRRDDILEAVSLAAEHILRTNLVESIPILLERLGHATGVSRAYVAENVNHMELSAEIRFQFRWHHPDFHPDKTFPGLTRIPSQAWIPARWKKMLEQGQVVFGDLTDFPDDEIKILSERGVHSIVCVPIIVHTSWWGYLGFEECRGAREWSAVEIFALMAAANTIGAAIQHQQSEKELKQRTDIINTLLSVSETMGSTLNVNQILAQIIAATKNLLQVDRVAVFLWNVREQRLSPTLPMQGQGTFQDLTIDQQSAYVNLLLRPDQVLLVRKLLTENKPIAIRDAQNSSLIPPDIIKSMNIGGLLVVPMTYQDRFLGVLYLDTVGAPRDFTTDEIDLASGLARQTTLALERARLYTQSQQDADELSLLYRVSSQLLIPGRDIKSLGEHITQVVARELITGYCSLLMVDRDRLALNLIAEAGPLVLDPVQLLLDGPGLTVAAVQSDQVIYVPDVRLDPRYVKASEETRSELVLPLHYGETVIGVLNLESAEIDGFSERDRRLSTAFAENVALALQNVRLLNAAEIHAGQLALLNELGRSAIEITDFKELLDSLVNRLVSLINLDHCFLDLWNEESGQPEKGAASTCIQEIYNLYQRQPGEPSLTETVLLTNTPVVIDDLPNNSVISSRLANLLPIRSLLALPLIANQQKQGVVYLGAETFHHFTHREIIVCEQAARQIALAIARARSMDAIRRGARQTTLLNEMTRIALTSLHLVEMLQGMVDRLGELFSADGCYLTLWDDFKKQTIPGAAFGFNRENYRNIVTQPGDLTLTSSVLDAGHPLSIENVLDTPYISPEVSARFSSDQLPIVSFLILPLIAGDIKLGAVMIGYNQPHSFTASEIALGERAAAQIALAIAKVQSLDMAHRRAQEAEYLRKATAAIASSLDLSKVLNNILVHLEPVVPYDSACIFWLIGERLHAVAGRGFSDLDQVVGKSYPVDDLSRESIQDGRPIILADASQDLRFKGWGDTQGVRGWIGVPLKGRRGVIGYLTLDSRQVSAYDERSAELIQSFASQAAIAIENSQLFEASEQRAREAETLRQAGAIVTSALQQQQAIRLILEQLDHVVPYDSASVQLLSEGNLEIVGGLGWPEENAVIGVRFPVPGNNPNTYVIENRQPYRLNNAPEVYPAFRESPHNKIKSWLGVPLIVHEKVIGMLAIDRNEEDAFSEDHVRLASAFADQVAIVIENARLYAAEQQRVHQLDTLRATFADISGELELPRLLQTILERAVNLIGASGGELALYRKISGDLEIVACYQMGNDSMGTHLALGEGAMGRVAKTMEPILIQNYESWDAKLLQYAQGPWHTVMAAPLQVRGALIGAIGIVDSNPKRSFNRSDLQTLTMFAQQSSIAVDNAKLFHDVRLAAERRTILHRVSQEISASSVDPEQIYQTIHRAAALLMPAEAFVITLLNEANQEIDAVYLVDKNGRSMGMRIPIGKGLSSTVIQTGESIYIPDFLSSQEVLDVVRFGSRDNTRAILAVPLRLRDKVIGMLSTQSYTPNAYSLDDQHLLEMLASHAAIALENARLFSEIQWLAATDSTTGLYNRRGLFELGQREMERSRRFKHPLTAIMLDIDWFKQVNDTYGHSVGDQILKSLALACRQNIRDVDIIGRYGGEEYVIILPETSLQAGYQVANRLRKYVENMQIETDRGIIQITISLGVCELKPDTPDLAVLIDRADTAMYQAKQAGRNRVIKI